MAQHWRAAHERLTPGAQTRLARGEALRAARLAKGWTQSELAEAAGLASGQAEVSRLEGGRALLGLVRAERLAKVLGVTPESLLWPKG